MSQAPKGRIQSWPANLSGESGEFGQGTASPGQDGTFGFSLKPSVLRPIMASIILSKLTTMCVIEATCQPHNLTLHVRLRRMRHGRH